MIIYPENENKKKEEIKSPSEKVIKPQKTSKVYTHKKFTSEEDTGSSEESSNNTLN